MVVQYRPIPKLMSRNEQREIQLLHILRLDPKQLLPSSPKRIRHPRPHYWRFARGSQPLRLEGTDLQKVRGKDP